MQVSMKWLKDYIDFSETPEEIADKLTMAGVPVENVVHLGAGLDYVVAGRLVSVVAHPDSDHLKICTVDVAQEEPLTIVTGASNVADGQIVPVALVGAHLPNGQKIAKSKMRGVPSYGMLCSADELKLDTSKMAEEETTGIYILPEDTTVGAPMQEVLGLDDVVLEFELTANRADCFSVLGLLREIALLTGNAPKLPKIEVQADDVRTSAEMVKIAIEAEDLCPRFSACVLTDVKIAPSPRWMQERLAGAGIRSINNVVDVTNFVMVELGQPMHAYDYDKIKGHKLVARRSVAGEMLHTLDDSSRLAKGNELVIADEEKAAGLAGVMGGLETEITDATTTVVLESAAFSGPSIRRTSRACGLHSEASGRFERGVDVTKTPRALTRAAQLLQAMGACKVCRDIVDVYPAPKLPTQIPFTAEQINSRLGTSIEGKEMVSILERLGFMVESTEPESYLVTVPSWRNDVTCWEDFSEEIARIHGFIHIPSTTPRGVVMRAHQSERQNFIEYVKGVLTSLGMDEEASFAFMHPSMFDKLQIPADSELRRAIPIMNPLTDEYPLVRTTLLASIFENVMRNFSRKNDDIRLFEVAPIFLPKALPVMEQPTEVVKLAGLLTGRRNPPNWAQTNEQIDFFDAKGVVETLLSALRIDRYTVERGTHFAMHPGKTAVFKKGNEIIATVGEVHPAVEAAFDVKKKMFLFEMDVATLMKYADAKVGYKHLPKYPAIARDLAVLVSKEVIAADVEKVIKSNAGPYFKNVYIFDVYEGKQVAEGKKSLAFAMQFQSADKTLTDEEVDAVFAVIVEKVKIAFDAELRA